MKARRRRDGSPDLCSRMLAQPRRTPFKAIYSTARVQIKSISMMPVRALLNQDSRIRCKLRRPDRLLSGSEQTRSRKMLVLNYTELHQISSHARGEMKNSAHDDAIRSRIVLLSFLRMEDPDAMISPFCVVLHDMHKSLQRSGGWMQVLQFKRDHKASLDSISRLHELNLSPLGE